MESHFGSGNFHLQLDICLCFTSLHRNVTNLSHLIFLIKISWSLTFRASCRTVNITVNSPASLPPCDYFTAPTQYTHYTQKIKMIPACLRDSKGPVMLQTQEQAFNTAELPLHRHQGRSKAARQACIYIGLSRMWWEPRSWAGGGCWQDRGQGGSGSITGGCFYLCLDFLFSCIIWKAARDGWSSASFCP